MDKDIKQNYSLGSFIMEGTPLDIVKRYESLDRIAQTFDFGSFAENIVVLDTETTGVSFKTDEITQIAAARMSHGVITEWFVTFVNPEKPIPEEVSRLTNIFDSDVSTAPCPSEAIAKLVEFVGESSLVAHNAEFDRHFLTRHPEGASLQENVWIDSLDLARIGLPRLKSHRLLDIVRAFNKPLSTHRADADVASTCATLPILFAAILAMPNDLVTKIACLTSTNEWSTQRAFEEVLKLQKTQQYFDLAYREGWVVNGGQSPIKTSQLSKGDGKDNYLEMTGEKQASTNDVSRETSTSTLPKLFACRALRTARLKEVRAVQKRDPEIAIEDGGGSLKFPTKEEIEKAFSSDGLLGRIYPGFEPRREQVLMAQAVDKAFSQSKNLLVEAGTGVGKSMAYLVPSALSAYQNNMIVGVATKTNALLDQLCFHELPALNSALKENGTTNRDLTFASLKGYSHYACLRRVDKVANQDSYVKTVNGKTINQAPALAALLSYIEQTAYDDIDGLKIDYRALPRYAITTTSHECLKQKCPYYHSSCFVHGARRIAEGSDIVVTNHSLLFCDLAADGGLLPTIRYWVVDEAHGAESEARMAFSLSISADKVNYLANRITADKASENPLERLKIKIKKESCEESSTLRYSLIAKAEALGNSYAEKAEVFARSLKGLLFFAEPRNSKNYDLVEVWLNDDVRSSATFSEVKTAGLELMSDANKLILSCQNIVACLETVDNVAEIQREIAGIVYELKAQVTTLETVLSTAPNEYAYSALVNRKKEIQTEKLEALLYNVGETMNGSLFDKTHSVVFASATLSVDNNFDSFATSFGLNASETSQTDFLQLDSCYDFDSNMTIYVVSDMPEPNEPKYLEMLQKLLIETHLAQNGSMLTLFTNRREMEKCFAEVSPSLKAAGLRLACQRKGISIKGLRDDFLTDEHLSLFALKSFWEGFDAPGATLKGVIVPKLPFSKPSDPLSCERASRDPQAWRNYVLPTAVIETKQAAGRLIRSASDRGVLILADKRLLTKSYGKAFLNSLPSRTIKSIPLSEVVAELGVRYNKEY